MNGLAVRTVEGRKGEESREQRQPPAAVEIGGTDASKGPQTPRSYPAGVPKRGARGQAAALRTCNLPPSTTGACPVLQRGESISQQI